MPKVSHLIEMASGVPVVTLPAEVDVTSPDVLRAALLLAPRHGHATIVVDMTQTQLCDSSGLNMLVRAHKRAVAEGGELRLVIPDTSMLGGVLAVTGIDRLIPSFTSLDEALAETPAARTAGGSALDWSITAMRDATGRLLRVRTQDRQSAAVLIREAVWWVTIVDGTLVRYHREAYDAVLRGQRHAERRLIKGTLAGLRFARNRMSDDVDQVDFIRPHAGCSRDGRITAWTWQPVPEPPLSSLPPPGQAWEMTRYRAYEAQLAGHTVGEIFERAAAFLGLAAAKATSGTGVSAIPPGQSRGSLYSTSPLDARDGGNG